MGSKGPKGEKLYKKIAGNNSELKKIEGFEGDQQALVKEAQKETKRQMNNEKILYKKDWSILKHKVDNLRKLDTAGEIKEHTMQFDKDLLDINPRYDDELELERQNIKKKIKAHLVMKGADAFKKKTVVDQTAKVLKLERLQLEDTAKKTE